MHERPLLAVLAGLVLVGIVLGVGLLTQPRVPAHAFEPIEPGSCPIGPLRFRTFNATELRDRLDALPTYLPEDFRFVIGWYAGDSATAQWAGSNCRQVRISVSEDSTEKEFEDWTLTINAEDECSVPPVGVVDCIQWRRSGDEGDLSVYALGLTVEETERIARSIRF